MEDEVLGREEVTPTTQEDNLPTEEAVFDPEQSRILSHAKMELKAVGYDLEGKEEDPNKWMVDNLLELLTTFAKQGHSGFSASYCVSAFTKLASFEPLSPLTGEDWEWVEVGENLWQNNRCSHVFKDDKTAYDIDGKIFRSPDGSCYTNGDSRVPVVFPYTPTREYVDVAE